MVSDESAKAMIPVRQVRPQSDRTQDDCVAVEEPMEIRVAYGPATARSARSLSITMRTPGQDFELAAGFLFTEGILSSPQQIANIEFCGPAAPGRQTSNIVRVDLTSQVELDLDRLQRHFYSTSSCGICGKASLDALQVQGLKRLDAGHPAVAPDVIRGLPDALRQAQPVFDETGGLHGAGLFDVAGNAVAVREDVGRHNAVDKLLGRQFLDGRTPVSELVMVISGRASFEILQKALVAGVPMIVAVGAPSSLAVEMASKFGMTLVGFAASDRYNIYSAADRIRG